MGSSIDRHVAEIAQGHHGLFATHHLDEIGASRAERLHRLEHGRWEPVYDSVYRLRGAPRSWESKLLAACWAGGTRAAASHRSAAAIWALPGARRDLLEITCPRWRRAQHTGLVVHESNEFAAQDMTVIEAIPTTTVERTIFDLCRVCGPVTVDLAIDSALRRDLTTIESLVAARDRLATKGRPGGRRFRLALAERSPAGAVPESAPERLLARALVSQGLPEPVAQHVVRDHIGRFVARVDLAYPEYRIALEYDSFQEHTGKVALVRDSRRRNAVAALGWTPLAATADDVRDGGVRIATVVRAVIRAAAA
jgi:hypothetical protein